MKSFIIIFALLCPFTGFSQTISFTGLLKQAEAATSAKNWAEAITCWEKINQQNPVHQQYTYHLANAHFQLGNYTTALEWYEKNHMLYGGKNYYSAFNIARVYARLKDSENTMVWLKKSFELGMPDRSAFKLADFQFLRSNEAYQKFSGTTDLRTYHRNAGWKFDILFLKDEINRKAFNNVVRTITKDDVQKEVNRIIASIPKLTDIQLMLELQKLMVKLGDGHTTFYLNHEREELRKALPVEFYLFKEGLYIIQAEKAFSHLLGAKILSVENKSMDEVMTKMKSIMSADNSQQYKGWFAMRLRQVPLMQSLGISKSDNQMGLTIQNKNGQIEHLILKANESVPSRRLWDGLPGNWSSLENEIPLVPYYLKNRYEPYWYEYKKEDKTLWFQYNRVLDHPQKPYGVFLDELFTTIEKEQPEKLVIDLRNNNGGNGELSYPLIQQIQRHPSINQRGNLFVITGRKTFSAAGILISLLEKHCQSIFVGEPAGTSPHFIGEESEFELPYSKIKGNISDREHHYANAIDFRTWISPTLYIEPSFDDFIKGKDACWEAIKENYSGKK